MIKEKQVRRVVMNKDKSQPKLTAMDKFNLLPDHLKERAIDQLVSYTTSKYLFEMQVDKLWDIKNGNIIGKVC